VSWWNAYKPLSIVQLRDGCLGLRLTNASGERMTMPLGKATFQMLWPRPR
jgi:hypothetical protein